MPGKLSWSDTFAAVVVPDTISYILPEGKSLSQAPNQLIIDGFGTLPMQRTRVSVHNNELFHMVDNTVRSPLRAQVLPANTPAPAAPRGAAANQGQGYVPPQALGWHLGMGAGHPERDRSLFTLGKMLLFGASIAAMAVGSCLMASHPIVAVVLLVVGTFAAVCTLVSASYHIIGEVPAAEAAEAARAAEADLQDAMA